MLSLYSPICAVSLPTNAANAFHGARNKKNANPLLRVLVVLVIFFSSGVLEATSSNPIGVKYFQEAYYLFLCGFVVLLLGGKLRARPALRLGEFSVLFVVVSFAMVSPLLSFLFHGQPITYGIIEDRRIFDLLIFFWVYHYLSRGTIEVEELLDLLVFSAVVLSLIMIMLSYYGITAREVGEGNIRQNRAAVAVNFAALGILSAAAGVMNRRASPAKKLYLYLSAGLTMFALVFASQTRQVVLGVVLVVLLYGGIKLRLRMLVSAVVLLVMGGLIVYHLRSELFLQLVSSDYYEESVRTKAIATILSEIAKNDFIGKGALSLLWSDGFEALYGEGFFLADVGVFGSYYRLGVFFLVPYIVAFYALIKYWKRCSPGTIRTFVFFGLCYMLILIPVGAPLEHRGEVFGIVLAVAAYCFRRECSA